MNREKMIEDVKELLCHADWHKRYFSHMFRRFSTIDYWMRVILALTSLTGVSLAATQYHLLGTFLAAGAAFLVANVLPILKWDTILTGFREEQETWTRIYHGYDNLLRNMEVAERDELLILDFKRIKESQEKASLDERHLPVDQKILDQEEEAVRKFHALD